VAIVIVIPPVLKKKFIALGKTRWRFESLQTSLLMERLC